MMYTAEITKKITVLGRCVRYIDGTVHGISLPCSLDVQHAAYNGHKQKHALRFQTLTSPDGLTHHAHRLMEGDRHDWVLFDRSEMDR